MTRFLLRRLVFAAALVAVSSSAALLLARLAPGDLTAELGVTATREEIAATRARFELDRAPATQWLHWVGRAARLDFGESFLYGRPVAPLIGRAAVNTAVLGTLALLAATVAGLGLGIYTGSRTGLVPHLIRAISLLCLSLPPLLTSLLLVFVAARTRWLPVGGMLSAAVVEPTWGAWFVDVARHLPLPLIALAIPVAATFERLQSQAIAEAAHQPFVVAAAARGVPERDLILRHAWRVSLRAVCGVYGVAVGALLSGSFVVEFVTAWPGLGRLMYEALRARDIYLVAGCAAAGSFFLAVGLLLGDILLAVADPRTREGAGA